jgi:hypothetical protein
MLGADVTRAEVPTARGTHVKKLASSAAGAVLLLGALAACGDDSGSGDGESSGGDASSYCDDLKDAKEQFKSLEGDDADPSQLDEAFATMQSLGDEAPDEVAGDWKVMTDGFDKIEKALDEAGLSMEDLANPEALADLDPAAAQKLSQEFTSLDSQEFSDAGDAITKHAKDECDVDLEEGSGDSGTG